MHFRQWEMPTRWVAHRIELEPFLFGLLFSKVPQLSLVPAPGSKLSTSLKLCGLEKNGKELAHLHGGRGQH